MPENEPAPSSNVPESTSSEGSSSQLESVSSLPEPSSSKTEAQTEETEGKALVVYFSHTGTTEGAANEIAAQTGADVFEIVPTETYTSDYNTLLDIAPQVDFFDALPQYSNELYCHKKMKTDEKNSLEALKATLPVLESLPSWTY